MIKLARFRRTGKAHNLEPIERLAISYSATVLDGVEDAGDFLHTGLCIEQR